MWTNLEQPLIQKIQLPQTDDIRLHRFETQLASHQEEEVSILRQKALRLLSALAKDEAAALHLEEQVCKMIHKIKEQLESGQTQNVAIRVELALTLIMFLFDDTIAFNPNSRHN